VTGEPLSSDLAGLRREFEGSGWRFSSVWASAGTGPDARRLTATRGTVLLTAWTGAELRMKIRAEERQPPVTRPPAGR
jgi:hypothetical protein